MKYARDTDVKLYATFSTSGTPVKMEAVIEGLEYVGHEDVLLKVKGFLLVSGYTFVIDRYDTRTRQGQAELFL